MLDAVGEDVAGGSTEASSSSSQTWSVRQALSGERWRNARPQLLEAMLEAGRVPKGFCQLCHVKEAVISCTDCLPKHMLCSQCDICVHRQYSCITDLRLSGAVTEPFLQRISLSMMRVVSQHWAKKVFMCIHFLWNNFPIIM